MRRSTLCIVLALSLALSLGVAGCGGAQFVVPAYSPDGQAAQRTIKVTGESEVRVVPDEVVITLGVETTALDLQAARQANDDLTKRAIDVAQEIGVRPEHIKTEYLSAEPRYRDSYEKRDFLGYYVRRTVAVTLKDMAKFEDLLTRELAEGVNYIHGIEFRTTELRKHKDTARALAIKAAREKAVAMAGELGQTVGEPDEIVEEQSGSWAWYSSWWGSRWGNAMSQNVVQNAAGSAPSNLESMSPGQITINARVSVTFALNK